MMIRLKETQLSERFREYTEHALKHGYVWDNENKDQLTQAFDLLQQNKMGIWLSGNSGSGKTLFFDICQRIIHPKSENSFIKFHMSDVVLNFNAKGSELFHEYKDRNVLFDDVFTENKGQYYSDKNVEVFELFVYLRYDQWRKSGVTTHITTNNTRQEFINRYGSKCVFRLDEMTQNILLGAKPDYINRRTYKNFIEMPTVYHPALKTPDEIEWEKNYNLHREAAKNAPRENKPVKGIGTQLREALEALQPQQTESNDPEDILP